MIFALALLAAICGCGDKSATNPTAKSSPAGTNSGTAKNENRNDATGNSAIEGSTVANSTIQTEESGDGAPSGANSTATPKADEGPPPKPATVEEARRVLDLTTFPLPEGAETGGERAMAHVRYNVTGSDVKAAYGFVRKQFTERAWKETGEKHASADSEYSEFERQGFHASAFAGKDSSKPGSLYITITNQGNLNLVRLPVPPDAKVQPLISPTRISYVTDKSPEVTAAAVEKLLLEQGWIPYGHNVGMKKYKQNAIELKVVVHEVRGRTSLSFHPSQMSADLPPPPEAISADYTDMMAPPKQLIFETAAKQDALYQHYRDVLAKDGWQPTSERPISGDYKSFMIFRNAAKDLIELETYATDEDGKIRGTLRHQSAAERAEIERQLNTNK
jgi:hypothetical protein